MLKERELSADSVIKNYLTTASDGKSYEVLYYSSKVYDDFDKKRKDFEAKLADQQDIQFLEIVEQKVKATKENQ